MSIKSDEQVILFPAVAAETGPDSWAAPIRGWIYEPEEGVVQRSLFTAFEALFERWFDLTRADVEAAPADEQPVLRERAGMFLVDNERRKRISVSIGGRTIELPASGANGHFEGEVTLAGPRTPGERIEVRAVVPEGDARIFASTLQFVGREGLSVVSDIDDTIKDSNVLDKRELGRNTFLRAFRSTNGMSHLYQRWAAAAPLAFHYVSGSPFQLYPSLAEFAGREGFPAGSFHLRLFRLKDPSVLAFFGDPLQFKLQAIDPLMRRFPGRRFILVGDSGEHDPEVYTELASRFPHQVAAILIRDVRGEDLTSERFTRLYANLPDHIERRVFKHPGELEDVTPDSLRLRAKHG
jgi:hypothetical protein